MRGDLPSNWQEVTSAEDYEKDTSKFSPSLRQGGYLSGHYNVQLKQELSANPFATPIVRSREAVTMPMLNMTIWQ